MTRNGSYRLDYPPLEGEGRRAPKVRAGVGWRLSEKNHPTPTLTTFASTLPLQGR